MLQSIEMDLKLATHKLTNSINAHIFKTDLKATEVRAFSAFQERAIVYQSFKETNKWTPTLDDQFLVAYHILDIVQASQLLQTSATPMLPAGF